MQVYTQGLSCKVKPNFGSCVGHKSSTVVVLQVGLCLESKSIHQVIKWPFLCNLPLLIWFSEIWSGINALLSGGGDDL